MYNLIKFTGTMQIKVHFWICYFIKMYEVGTLNLRRGKDEYKKD